MKRIYITKSAPAELKRYIAGLGSELVELDPAPISSSIASHADISVCRLNDDIVLCAAEDELGDLYPQDAVFNACSTGRFFIHRLDITSNRLLQEAERLGLHKIVVKQGYSRCSALPVDEASIITSDKGIAAKCLAAGLDVLSIQPGHIILEGYNSGFIGGTSGRVGDVIVFNGDLRAHPDFDRITAFIEARGLKVKWFEGWPLTDIGSIV